jgi:hypothetical protein
MALQASIVHLHYRFVVLKFVHSTRHVRQGKVCGHQRCTAAISVCCCDDTQPAFCNICEVGSWKLGKALLFAAVLLWLRACEEQPDFGSLFIHNLNDPYITYSLEPIIGSRK